MKRAGMVLLLMCAAGLTAMAQGRGLTRDAKVFIQPNEGFETYLRAAFEKKGVPLLIVTEKEKADFIMTSTVEHGDKPGLATAIFLGKRNANEDASISIVDPKTSVVVFAYSVHKYNAVNGQQSAAEAIAKNVKNKMKKK